MFENCNQDANYWKQAAMKFKQEAKHWKASFLKEQKLHKNLLKDRRKKRENKIAPVNKRAFHIGSFTHKKQAQQQIKLAFHWRRCITYETARCDIRI